MQWGAQQIRWAKRLDRLLGAVLAWCRRPNGSHARAVPRRILFVKFWGMGSIVLCQPALEGLRRRYPEARIHFLTTRENRPLVELFPEVDQVHELHAPNGVALLLSALRAVLRLRRLQFDLVLDGEVSVAASALFCRALRAPHLIGFAVGSRTAPWYRRAVEYRAQSHAVDVFKDLVGAVAPQPEIKRALRERPQRPRLKLPGPPSLVLLRPYLVFNVNASPLALERRWPRQRFIQLGRTLLRDFDLDLVLIGSAREQPYVAKVSQALGSPSRVRNLAGCLGLVQLAELIADATALISSDSGPVHLASAFDVPVVALYGPETPVRYGPLSRRQLVFFQDIPCSPCMSVHNAKTVNCSRNQRCMREIDTLAVIRQVSKFLSLQDKQRPLVRRRRSRG